MPCGIAELLRRRRGGGVCAGAPRAAAAPGPRAPAGTPPRRIFRPLAVRAPVAQVLARRAVEHDDAPVAVAVGDEHLVVRGVDPDLRRPAHQRRVVAAAGLVELADHQRDLAGARELDRQVALARVGPHEAVVIDEHAVDRAPVAVRARARPTTAAACPADPTPRCGCGSTSRRGRASRRRCRSPVPRSSRPAAPARPRRP